MVFFAARNHKGAGLKLKYIFAALCTLSVAVLVREWVDLGNPPGMQTVIGKRVVSIHAIFSFSWAITGICAAGV